MDAITPIQILILMGAAIISALLVLWLAGMILSRAARRTTQKAAPQGDAFFLYRDDQLVDLDIGAQSASDETLTKLSRWEGFRTTLQALFPELPDTLADLPGNCETRFDAQGAARGMRLICHREGANTRLHVQAAVMPTAWHGLAAIAEGQTRLAQVEALRDAPCAICVTDDKGHATWHNTAWKALPRGIARQAMTESAADGARDDQVTRIKDPDAERCFEMQATRQGAGRSLYVTEVTGLVRAENAQRKFVQTLTKTFANLTTGLAVFDRNQELALFNPALLDLTSLPAAFLTARPHVMSFSTGCATGK